MNPRQTRRVSVFVLTGMFLVILTHLIRPHLDRSDHAVVFIFGVLPNFGAAFGLPFLLLMTAGFLTNSRLSQTNQMSCFLVALGVTLLGLAGWEVVQYLIWKYPMDVNDILFTGAGGLCALGAYALFL